EYGRDYIYEVEQGKEYYTVKKNRPLRENARPRYTCSRPKEDRWGSVARVYNLGDPQRRIPYRLPELEAAEASETVYLVEGEKDVEAIRVAGGVATTAFGGANGWKPGWGERYLAGRHVLIVADR